MQQRTEKWEKVNPLEKMEKEDFITLFENLELSSDQKERLNNEYWLIYLKFLEYDVEPKTAWIVTKNIFIVKESKTLLESAGIAVYNDNTDNIITEWI